MELKHTSEQFFGCFRATDHEALGRVHTLPPPIDERIKGQSPCSNLSMVSLQCQLHLLSQRILAPDATTSTSSSASRHPQPHTRNLSTPEQFPSGTNLTKKPPKRLPSTASRVVCTSSPSPFVDVIPHIGSLSTTFQIQVPWLSGSSLPSLSKRVEPYQIVLSGVKYHKCDQLYACTGELEAHR